ncbi:branched-chain amino acid ABC transporter permease [Desulfovibrio mangrovi]|uniref:branched-chain amino acid ABC transporter permease n=1 Tax=Desulfovibrio mangrovi TaxID=2976983 RepID=UPI002247572E|nr:branched-chain amino acid ABC transporter permease [Desulfovibrio mangrovi]UZP69016.1 branched-chain amino acid ABC transporter permease [Desulfovibrio mangrovi]
MISSGFLSRLAGGSLLPVALFFAAMLAMPYVLPNPYYVSTLTLACINAIIVVGLNLLLGFAGQISLGHAAFYGIAAYATGVATATYGLSMGTGFFIAVGLAAAVALVVGIPTLKLTGHYLAMGTLGFGIIVYIFFNESIELTGGPSGMVGIPRLALFGHELWEDTEYFYVVAAALSLVLLLSLNLIRSRFGRALMAIHTSEKAAMCIGVDIARYKLFVFVLSAVYAAVAGFLYAHYLGFVAPSSFGFHFSVQLIVMVVVGGMASVWGAVAGAFFLTALPEFLRVFENVETLIYGALLVLCMMFMPQGLVGGLGALVRRLRRPLRGKAAPEEGSHG